MGISDTIKKLEERFGERAVFRFDEDPIPLPAIKTGSFLLDEAIGIGGIPQGRIIEIYGPEGSGKTTLALHIIAECQKMGDNAMFIDAEHSLDLKYAKNIGIDINKLLISQPSCGEEALEIMDSMIRSGEVRLIVIDSVAALTPKSEIEGNMGDSHMGLQARLMSQALRKITGIASKTNCAIVFINQMRSKIGIIFGSPETTTGGNALKFYASVRIDIRKRAPIKEGEEIIGNEIDIKIVKNKVGSPFRIVHSAILFGKGIYKAKELLSKLIENGEIIKAGAWFKYGENKIHGEAKMLQYIEDNLINSEKY